MTEVNSAEHQSTPCRVRADGYHLRKETGAFSGRLLPLFRQAARVVVFGSVCRSRRSLVCLSLYLQQRSAPSPVPLFLLRQKPEAIRACLSPHISLTLTGSELGREGWILARKMEMAQSGNGVNTLLLVSFIIDGNEKELHILIGGAMFAIQDGNCARRIGASRLLSLAVPLPRRVDEPSAEDGASDWMNCGRH